LSNRLERRKRDHTKKTILKYALMILAIVIIAGIIYLVGKNLLTAYNYKHQETMVARYGNLEERLHGDGLVLRSETVISAPADGYFENMISDGTKVSLNTLLGYYLHNGDKTALRAPVTGLFTRQIDGLEEALQDIKLSTVGPEVFSYKTRHQDPEKEFNDGQGVCKVVNNLQNTRLILQFPLLEHNLHLEKNQTVRISVDGQPLGECTVIDFKKDFQKLVIMIETANFREELLNRRQVNVELTLNSQNGYIIPQKSLTNRGKEKGIYCIKGEEALFRPVHVLDLKGDTALVDGLQENDMVVLHPEKIKL
jgi:putative membrane fusion protein